MDDSLSSLQVWLAPSHTPLVQFTTVLNSLGQYHVSPNQVNPSAQTSNPPVRNFELAGVPVDIRASGKLKMHRQIDHILDRQGHIESLAQQPGDYFLLASLTLKAWKEEER